LTGFVGQFDCALAASARNRIAMIAIAILRIEFLLRGVKRS
jgi:hypothetical protein